MTCLFVTGSLSMTRNSDNILRGFSVSPTDPLGSYLAALGLHTDTTISDDFYVSVSPACKAGAVPAIQSHRLAVCFNSLEKDPFFLSPGQMARNWLVPMKVEVP